MQQMWWIARMIRRFRPTRAMQVNFSCVNVRHSCVAESIASSGPGNSSATSGTIGSCQHAIAPRSINLRSPGFSHLLRATSAYDFSASLQAPSTLVALDEVGADVMVQSATHQGRVFTRGQSYIASPAGGHGGHVRSAMLLLGIRVCEPPTGRHVTFIGVAHSEISSQPGGEWRAHVYDIADAEPATALSLTAQQKELALLAGQKWINQARARRQTLCSSPSQPVPARVLRARPSSPRARRSRSRSPQRAKPRHARSRSRSRSRTRSPSTSSSASSSSQSHSHSPARAPRAHKKFSRPASPKRETRPARQDDKSQPMSEPALRKLVRDVLASELASLTKLPAPSLARSSPSKRAARHAKLETEGSSDSSPASAAPAQHASKRSKVEQENIPPRHASSSSSHSASFQTPLETALTLQNAVQKALLENSMSLNILHALDKDVEMARACEHARDSGC